MRFSWFCVRILPAVLALMPLAAHSQTVNQRAVELVEAAQKASAQNRPEQAVELLDQAIAMEPTKADLYRFRGRELFRAGRIEPSIRDFDKVATLAPDQEKSLWERGISHYYANQFERGAKQFELYQTFHDADVENAAWRYLCVARTAGAEEARKSILPIKDDARVPMMKIYALYQGKAKPEDVFTAAREGTPDERELNARLFYANLYVGLYYEAAGDAAKAQQHISEAATKHPIGHYMHDVARVHQEMLQRAAEDK